MAKHIIGKKVVIQIGGPRQNPVRDGEMIADLESVYVSPEEANGADSVTGHSSEIIIGNPDINEVNKIIAAIKEDLEKYPKNSRPSQITDLINIINQYEDTPRERKLPIAYKALQIGANIAQIASLLAQLASALNTPNI